MSEVGLYEAMSTLRAVRRLRPDPIPDDVLRRVIQAACWAPTGGNRQPWKIVAVRNPDTKRRLQELYIGPWRAYAKEHRALLDRVPAERRGKEERMIAAADHLAENLHQAPVIAYQAQHFRRRHTWRSHQDFTGDEL